jgi:putative Mg2+ transporter-C (MgtC) family protein
LSDQPGFSRVPDLFDQTRTHIPELEIMLRLLLAAGLGGLIGLDRELKDRPAGLRTHMMTALAAALFTVLTFEMYFYIRQHEPDTTADPLRIIEAVTAGVAFLAAGTIIFSRGKIQGLTTGAGMWLAGAIGMAAGSGFYWVAVISAVIALVILSLFKWLERRVLQASEALKGDPGDRPEGAP